MTPDQIFHELMEHVATPVASVVVAFLTLIGVLVNTTIGVLAKRVTHQVNDAVNHRHMDEPRLFDHVRQIAADVNELRIWREEHTRWSTRLEEMLLRLLERDTGPSEPPASGT